jgi:hypothetical protein
LERKNGWTLAEHAAGAVSLDGMQRLLRSAGWDDDGMRDDLRGYVVKQLSGPEGVLVTDTVITSVGSETQQSQTSAWTSEPNDHASTRPQAGAPPTQLPTDTIDDRTSRDRVGRRTIQLTMPYPRLLPQRTPPGLFTSSIPTHRLPPWDNRL